MKLTHTRAVEQIKLDLNLKTKDHDAHVETITKLEGKLTILNREKEDLQTIFTSIGFVKEKANIRLT